MSTRTKLATLALGATVAFAGPAFAEKMKATLNGASEVPANTRSAAGFFFCLWKWPALFDHLVCSVEE